MTPAPARAPRVAALVLAAGSSRRMGGRNKLLEEIDGVPLVLRAVEAAARAPAAPVVVVSGPDREALEAVLAGRGVQCVHNPRHGAGMSSSLRRGLEALPAGVDGALVCLGDMPCVGPQHLARLIAAFDPAAGRDICVPVHGGRRGNPVLWAARYFPEMQRLSGDTGARALIARHAARVCEVEMPDDAVLRDVDTPADLDRLRSAPGA